MTSTQTIVLVLAGALLAVAGITAAVHYRWLHWEIAIWPAMLVVFLAAKAVQRILLARADAKRPPR
jgi:hypothetical protein